MSSLKRKSFMAFAWNVGGIFSRSFLTFLVSIVLARLLSPTEFGLIGMAMVFIAISEVFIDVGFASALIQKQNNTPLTYSSVFWLNLFFGAILTLIFYLIAPFIGQFYENEEITIIIRWLSLTIILQSLSIVQLTILKKELNFRLITIRDVWAVAIGGVVGTILAFLGFGVYSLVFQTIITTLVGTITLWSTTSWKPDFKFSLKEVRNLIGFSSYVFFDRLMSVTSKRISLMVIGKVFNPEILGYYTRAVSLKDQVSTYSASSFSKVFYPILSSLQDDSERYRRVYFKVISLVSFLCFGVTGILYILGEDIIVGLFGKKWLPSVAIFQVIILMAITAPLDNIMISAFMGKGKSKENFYIGLIRKFLRVSTLFFAYKYDLLFFTIALVVASYIITIINIIFLKKYTDLSAKNHFIKIFEGIPPLLIAIIIFEMLDMDGLVLRIIFVLIFTLFYIGYNKLIKTEGYVFIINNYPVLMKKIGKFLNKKI